ncbi:GIY-YIG nuclease family protein [Vagococcus fluvialis]|uniref:GIY-YIG nuclease family protein n=1 Tax=Vagococcus fluvialis TaxID=2738 RepID=UPI001D0A7D5B|nr:GIY-YIG nuclease family protein [Vagococcus fluvialis]UDM80952.1 GIY-YIG nuclease family protein [Vagococcus fluvialis]
MTNSLDSIFEDDSFDELTKQDKPVKQEKLDPEVEKFQEILEFIEENKREPHRTDDWSNERALWARLRGFRDKQERQEKVKKYDYMGILDIENEENEYFDSMIKSEEISGIDDILNQDDMLDDFSDLLDISRYKKTVNAADKIGRRKRAANFEEYRELFNKVHEEIAQGERKIIPFEQYDIQENRFYIQNGVMMYIVHISEDTFISDNGKENARMHVVYENGTENKELLLQSLASSLYSKERHGRMVTDIIDAESLAESFGEEFTSGYIYVLKSLSSNPDIAKLQNLYKIGFTKNEVSTRTSNAENEVTYLNAPVKLVLSAEIKNVNAQKLEKALHHSFSDRQVIFQDNQYRKATEWYIVPIDEIENKINEIIASIQK